MDSLIDQAVNSKKCSMCQLVKPLDQFHNQKRSKDGKQGYCKPCKQISNAKSNPIHNPVNNPLHKFSPKIQYQLKRARHNRRVLLNQADKVVGTYTLSEYRRRKRLTALLFNHCCPYCGDDLPKNEAVMDHFMPVKRGGTNKITNIIFCCESCNSAKNAKPPIRFLRYRRLLLEPFIELTKDTWERYIHEQLSERSSESISTSS